MKKNSHDIVSSMTDEIQFKAMTPEQRAEAEKKMDEYDAELGICLNCGS